jgi:hypothetical protein
MYVSLSDPNCSSLRVLARGIDAYTRAVGSAMA